LYATVLAFNIGSAQVLRKNGFLEEGVQRAAVFKRGVLHDLRVFAKVRRNLDDQ
jgi:RimJ/RimL family protein N-acetyltransferase